jgi:predicted 2-oxoglutarate/Fe(II)-dependent dioxygenase YbiX
MLYEKYIKVYNNALPLKSISSLIKWLNLENEGKSFDAGKTGGHGKDSINSNIRKVQTLNLTQKSKSLTNVHWTNVLIASFLKAAGNYMSEFPYCRGVKVNQLEALRYEKTGHYRYHVDSGQGHTRTLSAILILNNDYEGGELCFDDKGSDFSLSVEPGSLIMWPSNFLFPHKVKPVTKGTRYSVVGWLD